MLRLRLLQAPRRKTEVVLPAPKEVRRWLGNKIRPCPMVLQRRVAGHDTSRWYPVAWIRTAVGTAECRIGCETWWPLRWLTYTRREHLDRLSRVPAVTWAIHGFCYGGKLDAREAAEEDDGRDDRSEPLAVSSSGGKQPPITRDNSLPCPYVYIVAQSKYILLYPIITPENSKMNSSWCTRPCQGSNLS